MRICLKFVSEGERDETALALFRSGYRVWKESLKSEHERIFFSIYVLFLEIEEREDIVESNEN